MKLHEILSEVTIPMDVDSPFDDMVARDREDSMSNLKDKVRVDRERIPKTPKKHSNIEKAKRIKNLALWKKRMNNPEQHETHHKYNLGGHGSAFLHR